MVKVSSSIFGSTIGQYLWNTAKIDQRSKFFKFAVPLLFTLIVVAVRLYIFTPKAGVPFMLFLAAVLISACIGGSKSAYWASFLTFVGGLGLLISAHDLSSLLSSGDFWQLIFYFLEVLFLSYLLSSFQRDKKQTTAQVSGIEQRAEEIVEREKHLIDFVSMATHELKTPVTVLKAYLQLVELRLLKDDQQEYLNFVRKMEIQLEKLLNIIADLLDSTRISSGSLSCVFNHFNLNDCVRDCVDGFKASNPEVSIICELVEPDPISMADKDRIDQIVTNFISNAIKYSPSEKRILIRSRVVDGMAVVSVRDHGMGIPYDQQKEVFSRFYRVKSKGTEKLPGLGLGLFICAEIIKKHHGQIGVSSTPGEGSEFWFSLPYQK